MVPDRTPIVDLHAHLPLQLTLPKRACDSPEQTKRNQCLANSANHLGNFEKGQPRFNVDDARNQGVSFGSVLYSPADELYGTCYGAENIKAQIKLVEKKLKGKFEIARDGKEFKAKVEAGKPAAFHCLEGAFVIEKVPQDVDVLVDQRVAYVVLAHLVFRGVSGCVNAFPFFTDETYEVMFPGPPGLTPLGKKICEGICQRGIIPDITHMTVQAAYDVFDIAKANNRPVIASHAAPQGTSAHEYKLNLCPEIIERIRDSGGVIGVIWFDHWLLPPATPKAKTSVDTVVDAVLRIRDIARTTDCIAVGSDLDGFIHPVTGLETIAKIRDLETALLNRLKDKDVVEDILWRNATRTLAYGWV
jgi:microsomal dipeptidase-like Zn-dependent dipeptidase